MNTKISRFVWMTAGMAVLLSCNRAAEEDFREELPQDALTSIEAYFAEAPLVKTSYAIGAEDAIFSWSDNDNIDVSVYSSADDISSYVVFKRVDAAPGDTSVEDSNRATSFTDGQDGNRTFKSLGTAYAMDKWAFYPSRVDETAQIGGYAPDWSIENDKLYMDLPSGITPPLDNPLAVVPMVGKKDGEGKYAFTQLTGVLAFTIAGLPDGADFISLTHNDVALSGSFEVTETTNGAVIEYGKVVAKDDAGLTLHFSGAGTKATFYFSLPVGIIPAGLNLTVGREADTDSWMTKTTVKPITIKRGTVMRVNVDIPYTPVDMQWTDYVAGTFVDQFLWGQHSWSTSTTVPVTVQRSGLHPEKYRIANPYAAAMSTFGYTPSSASTPDDYLVFTINDNGTVYFAPFVTGVDAGSHQIQIKHPSDFGSGSTANSKVASALLDGTPQDVELAPIYASYPYVSGQHWSRDGATQQHIHIIMSWDETWSDLCDVQYKDDFIFNNRLGYAANTYITLPAQASDMFEGHYRIPNPYPLLAAQLGYSIPSYVTATPDEYLYFNVSGDGSVTFTALHAGINLDSKDLTITHPSEISGKSVAKNIIGAFQGDGTPDYVQLAPIYHETGNTGYLYSRDGYDNIIRIVFPEATETWTSLGTGRFRDGQMWKKNSFAPYDVEVEVWRSDADANRYRVSNPYTVGNTAFKRTAAEAGGDEYLYLQVDPSNSQVSFGSLVTGMTWDKNGSPEQNNASTPAVCNWVIADKAVAKSLLNKDISASSVVSGSAAAPEKIQLNAGYYDNGLNTYFYTNSLEPSYLWFPGAYNAGETWTDYSAGTYKDNIYDTKLNGSSTLGTVAVTIQQSSANPKRFRLANPYKQLSDYAALSKGTADDYLYFQYDNGLVYFETLYPGIQMDNSSRELAISHPVDANINSYYGTGSDFSGSSVVSSTSAGAPKKIQLGAYWYDKLTPTTNYCYTRGGSAWSESTRIVINFDTTEKAVVTRKQYPLLPAYDNPVEKLSLPSGTLQKLVVRITGVNLSTVTLGLYQSGWMTDSYVAPDGDGVVTFDSFSNATVSADIDLNCRLSSINAGDAIRFEVQEVIVDGVSLPVEQDVQPHFPGIVLNDANNVISVRGDTSEVCKSFRIPAFCTTNDGTLIAAYDVRYDTSTDLQNDIDVGFRRSTDGGKTWEPLKLAMDMGIWGYEAQVAAGTMKTKAANQLNGIGDPCLLVDKNTGDIFCFALWTHGKNNGTRALAFGGAGYDPDSVPQLMMVKSSDDGLTWSEPVNLTRQVKQYDWRVIFQGPGNGITMSDGTLVIANQHQKNSQPLHAGIMYSKDHGLTWHMHKEAHAVTSESCVVEIEPGKLLLSMRDETNSHARRAFVTSDLGRSWTAHASNGQMIEPTCEASMIKIDAADNVTGQELIIFSNPHSTSGRNHITIQISTDKAVTWPYKMLIDEGGSLGYTCLTRIDASTIGIVYESSRGNIVFQAIPLTAIIN